MIDLEQVAVSLTLTQHERDYYCLNADGVPIPATFREWVDDTFTDGPHYTLRCREFPECTVSLIFTGWAWKGTTHPKLWQVNFLASNGLFQARFFATRAEAEDEFEKAVMRVDGVLSM